MIAVIADDFTGAAELAGIGLRYHMSVELATEVNSSIQTDLLVIATDTRSLPEKDAVQEMKKHTEALLALHPQVLFKKTDSVLRGHVLAEIAAQLPVTGCDRVVLVPANPALGRTIENGRYFIHGQPVHETSFSHDPEYAITSSGIEDMLRSKGRPLQIKKLHDALPHEGIIVGEATKNEDLSAWASCLNDKTLAAGASGFFNAILKNMEGFDSRATVQNRDTAGAPTLYVCGTTFAHSRNAIQDIYSKNGPVSYMPEEIIRSVYTGQYNFVKWANEVVALVKKHGKAIVAIHPETSKSSPVGANVLREKMAGLVHEVLQRSMIQELVIEGGATAWSVIKNGGLTRFFPVEEMAPGVVRMQSSDPELFVTVKPGSYQWPPELWSF